MAEQVLTFRSISFNDTFDPSVGIYMLQNVPEGLRSPIIRQSNQPLQNRHGILDGASYYGARNLQLTGKVIADSQTLRKTLEDNLRTIFALDGTQTGDDPSYYTLYMTDEDGEEKQMEVKVSRGIEFRKQALNPFMRDFIVELIAKYPVWLSQTLYDETVTQGKMSSTLTLPTTLPITFGNSFLNAATITNGGNFATFPVITITGEGENPQITNVTTGQVMKINTNIAAGDTLVIDCLNGTVTLNGTDILSLFDTTSQFIQLAVGANTIWLEDDSPASLDLSALVEYRYAWI